MFVLPLTKTIKNKAKTQNSDSAVRGCQTLPPDFSQNHAPRRASNYVLNYRPNYVANYTLNYHPNYLTHRGTNRTTI